MDEYQVSDRAPKESVLDALLVCAGSALASLLLWAVLVGPYVLLSHFHIEPLPTVVLEHICEEEIRNAATRPITHSCISYFEDKARRVAATAAKKAH